MKLKSLQIIQSGQRITSVDIFRSIAIQTVVLFKNYINIPFFEKNISYIISNIDKGIVLTFLRLLF